jgi:acyl-CoA synthetase (AMP-forming)/AMP-acid ligase II
MVAGSRPIEVTRVRFYHHRGRTGDMLRVSGIWISPAEIEDVLAGMALSSDRSSLCGRTVRAAQQPSSRRSD